MRNPAIIVVFVLLCALVFSACGSSSSDDEDMSRFTDDDDDYFPDDDDVAGDDDDVADDDDDTTDDDDDDDDVTDDDDDTAVDDDDDDTSVDDDDDTTVDDDDDTTVDDDDDTTTDDDDDTATDDDDDTATDDDDDTAGPAPTVIINNPIQGTLYTTSEIQVNVTILDATNITPYLDGVDVSQYLTITGVAISGSLSGVAEGTHTFSVTAIGPGGTTTEQVTFDVDLQDPTLDLTLPAGPVEIGAPVEAHVIVWDENGQNITSQVTITWTVNPATGYTQNGTTFTFNTANTWTITASCTYQAQLLTDTETVESQDARPDEIIIAAPATAVAGVAFTVNYVVLNQFDEIIDESTLGITLDVVPSAGVTIHSPHVVTCTVAVPHTITVSATGKSGKVTIQESTVVDIEAGPPTSVGITLDRYNIEAHEFVTYTAAVEDQYGNPSDDYTIYTVPTNGVTIDTSLNRITFDKAGNFTVYCQATGYGIDSVPVTVNDGTDPIILWDDPTCGTTPRGTWTTATSYLLEGRVIENESDLAFFTINDDPVNVHPATGCFAHGVFLELGLNFFYAEAEDTSGNNARGNISILKGSSLPNGSVVTDAIGARVNQSTFSQMENLANALLATLDLESIILGLIPTMEFDLGGGITVTAAITTINIGDPTLTLAPTHGGITIGGGVQPFYIAMTITVTGLDSGLLVYTGSVSATSISLAGDIGIAVNAGDLELTLSSFNTTLQNFTLTFPGFDPLLMAVFENLLETLIQDTVNTLVIDNVAPALEDALTGLDMSFDFAVGNATISLEADFSTADFDPTGGTIWLDGQFLTDYIDGNTPQFPGSFYTPSTSPTLGQYTPGGSPYGFGLAVADDFLNQALYEIYRSGVITFHIDQAWAQQQGFTYDLNTTDLALFLPELEQNYPGEPVEFWLTPLLPPVIVYDTGVKALDASLQMGDLTIDMMVVPVAGPPVRAFTMALAIDFPVVIDVDSATNSLTLAFGTPNVYVDIYNELYDFNDEILEVLAPMLIQIVVPFISDLLGEFPIPVLQGFTINVVSMEIFGTGNDFMGIFGSLAYTP